MNHDARFRLGSPDNRRNVTLYQRKAVASTM
jgi:hypothetical protein